MQAQAEVELAKVRVEAEEKRRADELQAEEKKRADESHIKIQIAQTETAKEQAKKDKGLKIKLPPVLQPLHPLVIKMPSPQSYLPL